MTEASQTRKPIDWEAVEREYRAGQLSVREIARHHSVTDTAIHKKAKLAGWKRALADKVRKAVKEELAREDGLRDGLQTQRDDEIVQTAARRGVELVRQHRSTLGRAHRVTQKLIIELEEATDNRDEIGEQIELERGDDKNPTRHNQMLRAVSLGGRAQTVRELSQALRALVPLERQAFGLDTEVAPGNYVISDRPLSNDEWEAQHATED